MFKRIIALILMTIMIISTSAVASAEQCKEVVYADQLKLAKVYIDNRLVETTNTYIVDGVVYSVETKDIWNIFKELSGREISQFNIGVWADRLGYQYHSIHEDEVYINKDEVPIVIKLNGENVHFPDQRPIARDNRTFVPVRTVAEILGCEVYWNQEQQRVDISRNGDLLILWIGQKNMWHNGQMLSLDVEPFAINGRTMLPVRAIAETLGLKVEYEGGETVNTVKLDTIVTIQ